MAQAASQSLLNYLRGEGPGYNMRIVTAVADTTFAQVNYYSKLSIMHSIS
jgi:hypothetical protein